MTYSTGRVVRVRFRADPSLLWDRLVLKHLAGSTYLVQTEAGEVYPLVLSTPPLLHIEVVPSASVAARPGNVVTLLEDRPLTTASELSDLLDNTGAKGRLEEIQILGSQSAQQCGQSLGAGVWRPLLPGTLELGEASPLPEGAAFFHHIYSNQSLADLGFAQALGANVVPPARAGGSAPNGGVSYRLGERSRGPAAGARPAPGGGVPTRSGLGLLVPPGIGIPHP